MLENERGMVIGVGDDEEISRDCNRKTREKKGRKQEKKDIVLEVCAMIWRSEKIN